MAGFPTDVRSIELMLARQSKSFSRPGFIYELKFDGHRLVAMKHGDDVQLASRSGVICTDSYPEAVASIQRLQGDFVIDCEVCVVDERGIPDFGRMQTRSKQRKRLQLADRVSVFAFDLMFQQKADLRPAPLLERKRALRDLIPAGHPDMLYVDYLGEDGGEAMFQHAVAMGMEGVVAKKADAPYTPGRTHTTWFKFKPSDWHRGWGRPPKPV
jgi:bifunctional non-homologous end joining protein LigD